MLFAADIGNTAITLGVFDTDGPGAGNIPGPKRSWRLSTSSETTSGGWQRAIEGLLASAGMSTEDVVASVVCSVVPGVEAAFAAALRGLFGSPPLVLSDGSAAGNAARMKVLTDEPSEVGADRVVNAAAAYAIHGGPVIVVDFGTALTVDYVDGDGNYLGGAIAPGVATSAAALAERAAMLGDFELERPARAVGRSTVEALWSGFYYGFSGLVDGIVGKMEAQEGRAASVVATGGGSGGAGGGGGAGGLMATGSERVGVVDESLTLKGLSIIYRKGKL